MAACSGYVEGHNDYCAYLRRPFHHFATRGEQLLRGKDVLGEPCLQRFQPPDGAANPIGQRRAIQLDALAREDLALSVERQVIAIFGDQNMGEKTGTRETLSNWTLRRVSLKYFTAGSAAIARTANAHYAKPRRHVIEHLAHRLTDHMQLAAAAGERLVFGIEPYGLARQVRRETCSIGLTSTLRSPDCL